MSHFTSSDQQVTISTVSAVADVHVASDDKFQIVLLLQGSATATQENCILSLENGVIYSFVPGQLRKLRGENHCVGYQLSIPADVLQILHDQCDVTTLLWQALGSHVPLVLQREDGTHEVYQIMDMMAREYHRNGGEAGEILIGYLKILMIHICQEFESLDNFTNSDRNLEVVKKFIILLREQAFHKKFVTEYADDLCITPNYLNSIVKKYTGYTASHHIQQFVVAEAKRHLIYSGLRMKEIAHKLGFDDQAHFSKYFKTYTGVNFSAFKKDVTQTMT